MSIRHNVRLDEQRRTLAFQYARARSLRAKYRAEGQDGTAAVFNADMLLCRSQRRNLIARG